MNITAYRSMALAIALPLLGLLASPLQAQEATIRKNLSERLPNLPKIEEVRATSMPGLFEVRINQSDLFYSDAKGDHILLQGELYDTVKRVNLTEARINQLTAIDFKQLPLKDAVTTVRGNGQRKIAVFSDPNCGFCKRLERDLAKVDNVTVYTFLVGMLGPDSQTKSRHIWCAKDPSAAYNDWMLNGKTPASASCQADALERNMAFAAKYRITGTPTSFLADGTRVNGADFKRIEQVLAAQK
jgi:thiol:disulfide interchange protein DsbC